MVEQRRGEPEVFDGKTGRERVENLLKEIDASMDARVGIEIHFARRRRTLGIKRRKRSAEMNPIDCPGIGVGSGIGVGFAGGQNEIAVRADLMGTSTKHHAPVPLHTIDEHILPDRVQPFAEMVRRTRVIPYIGNV